MQVSVHARLQDLQGTNLRQVGRVGIEAERAGDEGIELGVRRFLRRRDQVDALYRAEFRPDEDRHPLCLVAFLVVTLSADIGTSPRSQRAEVDLVFLVGLLDAGRPEVFQNQLREVLLGCEAQARLRQVDRIALLIDRQRAVRRQALDRERPGHADFLLILVGLIVEIFAVSLRGDGGIDLLLAADASLPPFGMELLSFSRP